ncbi:MAG: hypothetical protein JSW26_13070 [Desulfobacterales bacterium]|nr:MAG: hypothetical protein JSW26_13070 [Desulfobacterales bacterium]
MITLNVDDLKPGMILAQPVRNRQGILLLEADARITNKNIRIFKSWGVKEIAIKGDRSDSGGTEGDARIQGKESIEKQLKEKFSDVLDDPVMVEIFKAAATRLIQNLQTNESEHEPS